MIRGSRRWWPRPRRVPEELSPREAYRRWARTYGEHPNAFQRLEGEAMARLFGDVCGLSVLDLGCGKARLASQALAGGARLAVAADLVLAMHTHAAAGDSPARRPLRLVAATHPLPFRPSSFDVVACALVLGHVADLAGAVRAMADSLRRGGRLLISDFHPFATLRGHARTFDDRGTTRAVRQHVHLLGDYIRLLVENGLVVDSLEEPRWQGEPVAFVLRAQKPR